MYWKQEIIAAAGSLILALPAFGQAGTGAAGAPPPPGTPPVPNTATRAPTDTGADQTREAAVLGMLHKSNQDEIAMANLAKDKSSNKAVKDYADMIISDHKKADDEVMSFAKAHNLDIQQGLQAAHQKMEESKQAAQSREVQTPTGERSQAMPGAMPGAGTGGGGHAAEHKKALDQLSKLNGPEFDRQFVKTMADDHRKVIEHLNSVRSKSTDAQFAQLIDKLLPTLQKHENTAVQLENKLSKAS